jgi:hypothetical protein
MKAQFLFGFFDRAADAFQAGDGPELALCSNCGNPTTGEICAFCRLRSMTLVDIGRRSDG